MHDHSDGFWRRFLKIVFRTSIPEPDQDHGLLAKLHEELPQILAWMVEGYRQWREVGLEPPTSVLLATAESQRSSDLVGQFIEEHITQAAGAVVEMSAVYERYQLWCEQCGLTRRLSSQQLSSRLVEHGLQRDRDDRSRRSVLQDVTLVPMATTGIASWQT